VADFIFGAKDTGASVRLPRGAKITIELQENPTTGYRWMVSSIDEVFLVPQGDAFLTGDQMGLGAGGLHRFFFGTKGPGSTALTLINKRAWQRDDQAVGRFNLAIQIGKQLRAAVVASRLPFQEVGIAPTIDLSLHGWNTKRVHLH
jgi:inhibitor of cysteine peptidase